MRSAAREPPFLQLPPLEVLAHALSFLDVKDGISAACSSKDFMLASQTPAAWCGAYNLGNADDDRLALFTRSKTQIRGLSGLCYITDVGLARLEVFNLRSLELAHCAHITDAGLKALRLLPLTSLNLSNTKITDMGMLGLSQLPLTTLVLRGTEISDEGLFHLVNRRLASLDSGAHSLLDKLDPTPLPLTFLDLCATNITDEGIGSLVNSQLPLSTLIVNRTRVTGTGLANLVRSHLPLTIIGVDYANMSSNMSSTLELDQHLHLFRLQKNCKIGEPTMARVAVLVPEVRVDTLQDERPRAMKMARRRARWKGNGRQAKKQRGTGIDAATKTTRKVPTCASTMSTLSCAVLFGLGVLCILFAVPP
jgi:hypothetical protein